MTREDSFQKVIGICIFALPLLYMSTFAIGLGAVTIEWHAEFLLSLSVISAVFGFLVIKKIVKNMVDLFLGTIVFVAAYINLIILVFDGLMSIYDPIAYPLFLILIGFMLIYPLFEWRALADPMQKDAMLPLQVKGEHFLERVIILAGGRRSVIVVFYLIVYGSAIGILYWLFEDLILSALLIALFVPLINLGYLTGRGLGDDLLWWKTFRSKEQENENQFQWVVVDWDRKWFRVFQKITLGNKFIILLGAFLLLYSLYGLYTDVLTLTTGFVVTATVGLTLVAKTLILSGRNAVNETKKLFDATRVKDNPSRFSLFYPIYIGVAIFLVVAVEFLVNMPGSVEQLAMGLGILQHRTLLSALLLVEELVMVMIAGMVLIREKQPIVIRDVREDEFSNLAPVEQHLALKKWHKDAQTLPLPERRLESLNRVIRYAPDLLKTRILLPFLTSSYDAIKNYARGEFKRLLVDNPRAGVYCLTLLEKGSLQLDTQKVAANILAFESYMDSLRTLAQTEKINANWLVTILEGHEVPVKTVFADEKYLYTGARDGIIRVWDKKSWQLVSILEGHTAQIHSFRTDDRHLYSGSGDGLVRVWEKESLSLVKTLDHGLGVWWVFVDDKYFYSHTKDRVVHVWDRETFNPVTTLRSPDGVVAVWADDRYIFTGSNVGAILVWDKTTFELRERLEGHDTESMIFGDDTYLYSASKYNARIWDRETLAPLRTLKDDSILGIWTDEKYLYTSRSSWFRGGPIRVWNKETLTLVKTLEGHIGVVNSLFVDDSYIYSASEDNTVRVWDKETMYLVTPPGHSKRITSVCSDEKYAYSASEDSNICVWNKKTLVPVKTLDEHNGTVTSIATNKHYLYSGSEDQTFRVWNKKTLTWARTIDVKPEVDEDKTTGVTSLYIDETYIYTGSWDSRIRVWDRKPITLVKILTGHTGFITAIVADRKHLYTGSSDNSVRVWDKKTLTLLNTLRGHIDAVTSIWTDKRYIYSGSMDRTIRVWNKKTFVLEATLEGHTDGVTSIWTDKRYIYSGSMDRTIRVWDKKARETLTLLEGHTEGVTTICADRHHLYSGSEDLTIKKWARIPTRELSKALILYSLVVVLFIFFYILLSMFI